MTPRVETSESVKKQVISTPYIIVHPGVYTLKHTKKALTSTYAKMKLVLFMRI